ncbi:hypothetical protein MCBRY_000194 [Methylocystis bryophila]
MGGVTMATSNTMPKTGEIATVISTFFFALATFLALSLGDASPVRAQQLPTYGPLPCPGHSKSYPADPTICVMTIKIFNDDPNHYIYPVLETGQGNNDLWMQAWFSVMNSQLAAKPYPRNNTYRIYINPTNGIPPHTGVSITLPLYTQLMSDPINSNPGTGLGKPDTFIDWWSGGNILVYTSPGTTSAVQPPSLTNAMLASTQKPLTIASGITPAPIVPTCVGVQSKFQPSPPAITCEPLTIYKDTASSPANGGSQLLEYTLGARNVNVAPRGATDWIAWWLDTSNVDFDVSYVNHVWMPAVMGPYLNDQVGYTGAPQTIDTFKGPSDGSSGLKYFQKTNVAGWPQYYDNYSNIPANTRPPAFTYLKFPSLLVIFQQLAGANPPSDLVPAISPTDWAKGPPASLAAWPPIQGLYTNWINYAGTYSGYGSCQGTYTPGNDINTWCTALLAQKALLLANYANYRALFNNRTCSGTPLTISDALLIGHLYGFTSWVEATGGSGCAPKINLLQDTPGFCVGTGCPTLTNPNGGDPAKRDYSNYNKVKTAFDKLNYTYDPVTNQPYYPGNPPYIFNPYAQLIHTASPNLNIPCAYGYSVDDAQGNVQAQGQGFIVDVGDTVNLENQHKCNPPINITLGYDPNVTPRFYKYAVCKISDQQPYDRVRPVIPGFASFDISAQNPQNCPIYLWDNKNDTDPSGPPKGQMYTFTMLTDGSTQGQNNAFPFFQNPANAMWTTATSAYVGCKGNASNPFSSQLWCCEKLNPPAGAGVYGYSMPIVAAHAQTQYTVTTIPAESCTTAASCNKTTSVLCNTNQ